MTPDRPDGDRPAPHRRRDDGAGGDRRAGDWLATGRASATAETEPTGTGSMRAVAFRSGGDLEVTDVPRPEVVNPRDVVVRVSMSSTCGSDLHLLHGLIPTMRDGDVVGHEFVGEVESVGRKVDDLEPGERVVVAADVGCGACSFCSDELWSLCDNTNPQPRYQERLVGYPTAAIYGYSHAFGGYAGSHAEYVRVPHGEVNCFPVPDELALEQAVFASDAMATGYMGADFADVEDGDVVAVWGCGGVGLMAQHAANHMGAERVIGIDREPERLRLAREEAGAETLDFSRVDDVLAELRERTGGRGPDACVDAVGMEANGSGVLHAADRVKQAARLQTDRGHALRQAIRSCRKGGRLVILGVYGVLDTVPLGAVMNKGLTVKTGQLHAQRYVPELLELAAEGEIDPSYLASHAFSLEEAPRAYDLFERRADSCVRPVLVP